jgi:hypothetical protein
MSDFMRNLEKQSKKDSVVLTENGAIVHTSTLNSILDMFFKVSSYRNVNDSIKMKDFSKAFEESAEYALKFLYFSRDAREGLGERALFRCIITFLACTNKLSINNMHLIPEYGRWDDLFCLLNTPLEEEVLLFIAKQLATDLFSAKNGEKVSLLGKWLPSENATSKATKRLAHRLMTYLKLSPRAYRKNLSMLRKKIDIVESKMSANEWGKIDYSGVPSKANITYRNAFYSHDPKRRAAFLAKVEKGEEKINSSTTFPHEIAAAYFKGRPYHRGTTLDLDASLEALWKALPSYGIENTLVVADGSGSMTAPYLPGSHVVPLNVANALSIYCAEHNKGIYKNKYITFSETPQFVELGEGALCDKLRITQSYDEVANTNIEAVFDLILETGNTYKIPQSEMPKSILIISDMEFDAASDGEVSQTLFEGIKRKYNLSGYTLPRLVFWNVCGRTGGVPVRQNEAGVALISGFSVNLIKMVMSDEIDPWKSLKGVLDSERYSKVK